MPYQHIVFIKPTNLSFQDDIEEKDMNEVKNMVGVIVSSIDLY